jgi:RNA polymerase sigma-70 factor (ECF subfamily)
VSTTSVTLLDQLRHRPAPEAWQRFVDIYSPILLRYAISRGVHRDAAADLIQDVFVVLLEKLPTFEYQPGGGFRRWLFTILINKWRDRKRVAARAPVPAGSHLPEPPADDDPRTLIGEAEYHRQVVARAVALMQSEFEPKTWRACWEHGVLERPATEVAAELKMTENAVYLATSRVLRRLRGSLRGLLD